MNKSTKGAIAAAAAGALLLGGAGTLAYWTADDSVDGGSVTAGDLTLTADDCAAGDWTYADGSAGAGDVVQLIVPGDVIAKDCTFTIGATGDNLSATVSAPTTVDLETVPTGTSLSATVAATYDVAGTAILDGGTITSSNDGDTLTATFEVTIPSGTDETGAPAINANDTQNIVASLDDLTLTLTQDDPNP